jgi:DNA-directed RNA polymerase specialized sigma24 family protein
LSLNDELLELMESNWAQHETDNRTKMLEALGHCLELLPPSGRQLIQRRYVDQVRYETLASDLKRPVTSLYVTFSRIYAALADCIFNRLRHES